MSRTRSRARWMNVLAATFMAASLTAVAGGAVLAAPQSPVAVSIKAQNLEGTRPDGGPVTLWLNFDVSGNDVSALAGDGKAFGSSGAHIEWSLRGSMDGDVVTLTGVATDANNPALIGMPGSMVANAATGTVTFSWTIQSGPFAGRSGIVQGAANVDIRVN